MAQWNRWAALVILSLRKYHRFPPPCWVLRKHGSSMLLCAQNGLSRVRVVVFQSNHGTPLAYLICADATLSDQQNKNMVMIEFFFIFSAGGRVDEFKGFAHAADPHVPQTPKAGDQPQGLEVSAKGYPALREMKIVAPQAP